MKSNVTLQREIFVIVLLLIAILFFLLRVQRICKDSEKTKTESNKNFL